MADETGHDARPTARSAGRAALLATLITVVLFSAIMAAILSLVGDFAFPQVFAIAGAVSLAAVLLLGTPIYLMVRQARDAVGFDPTAFVISAVITGLIGVAVMVFTGALAAAAFWYVAVFAGSAAAGAAWAYRPA